MEFVTHTLEPVYDERSKILILGSIPSPKSRQNGFYYGHPQNRFWPLLANLLHEPCPSSNEEKKALVLRHRIAVWDVLASCEIRGADDTSITKPVANDIAGLLARCPVQKIFTTGKKATDLYKKYCESTAGLPSIYLPSTSPANQGRFPMSRLVEEWQPVIDALQKP